MRIKKYLGADETSFKERYSNQARDFKHKKYMKQIEFSKQIWNLKNPGITPIVKWRIVKKLKNYQKNCRRIIKKKDLNLLVNADIKISCYYAIYKEMTVWIDVSSGILCLYLIFPSFCLYLDKTQKMCI